jgi:hypothetical protein
MGVAIATYRDMLYEIYGVSSNQTEKLVFLECNWYDAVRSGLRVTQKSKIRLREKLVLNL